MGTFLQLLQRGTTFLTSVTSMEYQALLNGVCQRSDFFSFNPIERPILYKILVFLGATELKNGPIEKGDKKMDRAFYDSVP